MTEIALPAPGGAVLVLGPALEAMARLPAESIDCVVTDPPYGIRPDGDAWNGSEVIEAAARAESAGRDGRLAATMFAGTFDLSLEGQRRFEAWTKEWAAEARRVLKPGGWLVSFCSSRSYHRMASGVEEAEFDVRDQISWIYGHGLPKSRREDGQALMLRPAHDPIVLARKRFSGSARGNVAEHGTGSLQVDSASLDSRRWVEDGDRIRSVASSRWPTNVAVGHGPDCTPEECSSGCPAADLGAAARYVYVPKPSRREKHVGALHNDHPTVKPVELMRWLCRLVTPPGGIVLDPFLGSGTTGCAAMQEGLGFVGIEREEDSFETAIGRIADWAYSHRRPRPIRAPLEAVS